MPILPELKLLWKNIKNIPDKINKLIELSNANGAVFLDADGNYRIVPFGNGLGQIAEGNHQHDSLTITSGELATNETTGSLRLPNIGMGDGNIFCNGIVRAIQFTTRNSSSFTGYNFWNNTSGSYRISLQKISDGLISPLVTGSDINMCFNISAGSDRGFLFSYNNSCIVQFASDGSIYCNKILPSDGVNGSFTSVDGKTITVNMGIVTGIV